MKSALLYFSGQDKRLCRVGISLESIMRIIAKPIRTALLVAMALTLSFPALQAEARQCEWRGTAPACDGQESDCRPDEEYIEAAGDIDYTKTRNSLAKFGSPCSFGGSKVLCCKKEAVPLTAPTAQFCNWYASEAVARAGQGAKCGFTGAGWDPNKQAHFTWCMAQKAQQQAWGEHNARLGALADCAKKHVKAAPPKGNYSAGAPEVTVDADVDIYKEPGEGQPFDILRVNTKVQVYQRRPDNWCLVAGRNVPGERGWVWCGKGFELD